MILRDWTISFVHIDREDNNIAHTLANFAIRQPQPFCIVDSPYPALATLLLRDGLMLFLFFPRSEEKKNTHFYFHFLGYTKLTKNLNTHTNLFRFNL